MQHAVHHHGPVKALDQTRHPLLEFEGFGMTQKIVQLTGRVLKRELNVIQPRVLEPQGPLLVKPHTRRNEVGIKTQMVRLLNQFFEVIAQHGFAAREAQLRRTQSTRLAHHIHPLRRGELFLQPGVFGRVVAKNTMQRTTIGEFSQQPQGGRWFN